MSTQAMQMAIGMMKTGLYDGPRLKVLMFMAWKHDHVSGFAWPSMERIAQEVGLTERGVRKIMQYLEEMGVIVAERGNGRGHLTRYRFPVLEKGERPTLLSDEKGGTEASQRGNGEDRKGERAAPAIRKEKQDQKLDQNNHHAGGAMSVWLRVKNDIKGELPADEWNLWLRPTYFLKEFGGGGMLLAVPPNTRIIEAFRARQAWLREKLAVHGYTCMLTKYPDQWELDLLAKSNPEWREVAERLRRVG